MVGGKDSTKKAGQYIEELADSVHRWAIDKAGPCGGGVGEQVEATSAPKWWKIGGEHTVINLPGAGTVRFGSAQWKSGLHQCKSFGGRRKSHR